MTCPPPKRLKITFSTHKRPKITLFPPKTRNFNKTTLYVESEPSVSVGDYFSESEGEYEETEQEVEARQDREFEEAQQMKFHTPWRMYHVSKQKGQNITMQDYKDGRRCYPMIESIADFWQQICNVPMPTELKVTHREDMYTVLYRVGFGIGDGF